MTGLAVGLAFAAVALLAVAGVLATAALAFERLSVPRAEKLLDDQVPGASELLGLMRTAPETLAALALLYTSARVVYVAVVIGLGVELVAGVGGVAIGVVVGALTLFVGVDMVAVRAVRTRVDRAGARLARLLHTPLAALGPVVRGLGRYGLGDATPEDTESVSQETEQRLQDVIDVAAADEAVTDSTHKILSAALELTDTVVREIMVPRPDMVSVPSTLSLTEVVDVVLDAGHSRVLVYGDDRDDISGVVYAKDLLALLHHGADRSWTELLRPPLIVPELKSVERLLRDLQRQRVHLAVVVDEYGATVGLVTIEDILEELVGEIVDEYDHEQPLVEVLDDQRWRVDARLPVDDLAELVDARLPDDRWDTVGGLLFSMLGHIATPGDTVAVDGVQLTAEQVRGRRISKVLVERRDSDEMP